MLILIFFAGIGFGAVVDKLVFAAGDWGPAKQGEDLKAHTSLLFGVVAAILTWIIGILIWLF